MTPVSPVKEVLSWVSSPEPCGLVAERVVMVVLGSAVTSVPFFSHEIKGRGKPLTTQNKVAGVFRALLTEVDVVWILGSTVEININPFNNIIHF